MVRWAKLTRHTRWAAAETDRFRNYATELAGLAPDVVFASTSQSVLAFQRATPTIPIVFAAVIDPVAQGLVDNIARPGANITGFAMVPEFSTSAKWLELLKQIAPAMTHVAVIRDAGRRPASCNLVRSNPWRSPSVWRSIR